MKIRKHLIKLFYRIRLAGLLQILLVSLLTGQTRQWTLSWQPNPETDIFRYNIYRGLTANPVTLCARADHPDTFFTDKHIQKGVLYFYRITAVDYSLNESPFSEQVSAAIPKIVNIEDFQYITEDSIIQIYLDDHVYDPDDPAARLNWQISQTDKFRVQIDQGAHLLSISNPDAWNGVEALHLTVADPDSFFDRKTVYLTSNRSGQINKLSSQLTINFMRGQGMVQITYSTQFPSRDHIEYGIYPAYNKSSSAEVDYSVVHDHFLSEVAENQRYAFHIVSETIDGAITILTDSVFTTSPQAQNVLVFPVPYRPADEQKTGGIIFENLLPDTNINIYNMLGEKVFQTRTADSRYIWDTRNAAGRRVQSGVYLYSIKPLNSTKTTGKLIIIR